MCEFLPLNWSVEEWTKVILALTALVAVIVGPFLQWQIAKRQAADNISSKRQNWIDELRKDSAEFLQLIAKLEELRRPIPGLTPDEIKQNFYEVTATSTRANEIGIRVKLRLNPNEIDHKKLLDLFKSLADTTIKTSTSEETEEQYKTALSLFNQERNKIIDQLQIIFKKEWERIKQGN